MATYSISPLFNGWQGFNAAGQPLNLGTIDVYLAGTSTPTPTYTSSTGAVQNSNPIVLNNGFPPNMIWLEDGIAVKFIVSDSVGNILSTDDNVASINPSTNNILTQLANTLDAAQGDALIGVKRSEASSVATTQHVVNQARDIFVAADRGAPTDGATSATSAINSAATNGGQKRITFEVGDYATQGLTFKHQPPALARAGMDEFQQFL